jgi:hypothetical protein
MPTAKKTKTASTTKTKQPAKAAKKKASAPALDWSATIKKAAEGKRGQANWPGTGDAWKKKVR